MCLRGTLSFGLLVRDVFKLLNLILIDMRQEVYSKLASQSAKHNLQVIMGIQRIGVGEQQTVRASLAHFLAHKKLAPSAFGQKKKRRSSHQNRSCLQFGVAVIIEYFSPHTK